jgi:hypothetical protein
MPAHKKIAHSGVETFPPCCRYRSKPTRDGLWQTAQEVIVRTLTSFVLALVFASGAALAQGNGDTPQGGSRLGDSPSFRPTVEQCSVGWNANMGISQAEFDAYCDEQ